MISDTAGPHRIPWRSAVLGRRLRQHRLLAGLLYAGIVFAVANVGNVRWYRHDPDAVTYLLSALTSICTAFSQILTQPRGTARNVRFRWLFWMGFHLLTAAALLCTTANRLGWLHVASAPIHAFYALGYASIYLITVNSPADASRRLSLAFDVAIAVVVCLLIFLVEYRADGYFSDSRLIFVVFLQLLLALAGVIAYASADRDAERSLYGRVILYFAASFVIYGINNLSNVFASARGEVLGAMIYSVPPLLILFITATRRLPPQTSRKLHSSFPAAARVLTTALLFILCLPLLRKHWIASASLVIAGLALFAIRVALLQLELERERNALDQGVRTLREHASTDALTGIANRRCFMQALAKSAAQAFNGEAFFTLVLFDLDNLKQVNDSRGHFAGDDCLREFTTAVNRSIAPPFDHFGRIGGDEFTLILQNVDTTDTLSLIEHVREALRNSEVRFCVGLAFCSRHYSGAPDDLLATADDHLYAAKRARGNATATITSSAATLA